MPARIDATDVVKRKLRGAAILLAATCATGTLPATAAIDLSAGGGIGVEYNTNPLEQSSRAPPGAAGGDAEGATSMSLRASVAAVSGGDGPLRLQLQASYGKVLYDRVDSLDNYTYSFGGNLDWRSSQLYDVSLEASQYRAPIGLADIGGDQATLQTTSSVEGTLRLRPVSRWQLGLTPGWTVTRRPLPESPDFELRETSGTVAVGFLGAGQVVPGVAVSESQGDYSGVADATRFRQRTVQGTLNYQATGFSTFALSAGYTKRTTRLITPASDPLAVFNEGSDAGFSGTLTYQRQLSAKTSIDLSAFRGFQQYDAGVNTTVGTGFGAGISWKATARMTMGLESQYTFSTIENALVADTFGDRKDLVRRYALSVDFLATRRLALRSYVTHRIRNSTLRSALFNATTAGLELTVTVD